LNSSESSGFAGPLSAPTLSTITKRVLARCGR
jgi:hypothetical protein